MKEQVYDVLENVPDGSAELAACFTARDYHDGQGSQLYRLASSGKVTDLNNLAEELREAIEVADNQGEIEDASDFLALLNWIASGPEWKVATR